MKTYQPKQKEVKRDWHLIDAKDKVLGRLSTELVRLLMGKHKATYSQHMDSGDYVVVTNAAKIDLTGRKKSQKVYYRHSMYPGGFKEISFDKMITSTPERVIELAVARMLPNNRLKSKRLARLKVFAGNEHDYENKFRKEEEK